MRKIVGIEDALNEAKLCEATTNQNNIVDKDAYIELIRERW